MGVCRGRLTNLSTLPRRAANAYGSYSANGSLQAMVVSRGWVFARGRLKKIITFPRRAANAYGSYSASWSLQAMVVNRDGCLQGKA